jgi:hypothetical protein
MVHGQIPGLLRLLLRLEGREVVTRGAGSLPPGNAVGQVSEDAHAEVGAVLRTLAQVFEGVVGGPLGQFPARYPFQQFRDGHAQIAGEPEVEAAVWPG